MTDGTTSDKYQVRKYQRRLVQALGDTAAQRITQSARMSARKESPTATYEEREMITARKLSNIWDQLR
jgi:hypothetical protein